MIPLEGAGKGDAERKVNKKSYDQAYDRIFGKKRIRCSKGFRKVWGPEETKKDSFYIPDITPRFNHGLGMVTHGTRDAEKKAKKMGLIPIGNERLKSERQKPKDTITPILREGLKKIHTLGEI